MEYELRYHYIKSDHILAIPEFDHSEYIETKSWEDLSKYIMSKKDQYGNSYRIPSPKSKEMFKFDFISNAGAVRVIPFKPKKIIFKKISNHGK